MSRRKYGAPAPVIVMNVDEPIPVVLSTPVDDDDVLSLPIDSLGGLVIIDWVHHEVHDGEVWGAEHTNVNVANGANLDLRISTKTAPVHFVALPSVGGQCLVYLYEAATISGGTAVTAYNLNRNDTTHTSPVTVTHTPTVTATGTTALVNGRLIAGGTSPTTRIGGGLRPGTEIVLKINTEYLLRVTNSSGGNIAINIPIEVYS